jgi:acyl phosphate:glycerol-3-phosphate acyltransferase
MGQAVLWTLIGFFLGSLPFSVLFGQLFLKKDIRQYGDGNPGGVNAWKAGGWSVGLLAMLFDVSKGLVPVLLARASGVDGWGLVPVALAPIIGHAASPFLKFRGGKALAVTGGVWIALIGVAAPIVYAVFTVSALTFQTEHAWTAISGMVGFLIYSLVSQNSPYLFVIALLNLSLLIWKHRVELRRPLQLRPWAVNLLGRRQP